MASRVAGALVDERAHGEDEGPRRRIERVLHGTFWRPGALHVIAPVLSLQAGRERRAPPRPLDASASGDRSPARG